MEEPVIAHCPECKELVEWEIVATNPLDNVSAERVWECGECGHEETEILK